MRVAQPYMKSTALLIYLSLFLNAVIAQDRDRIAGTVLNARSGQPVPNASIFINGTSKGTVTRSDGNFELTGIHKGNFELVVSSVGFQTAVYSLSSDTLPLVLTVKLEPRAAELDSVTIMPWEKNGWKKYGRVFMEGFIGTSAAAQDCEIKNRKVLRFRYSPNNRVLEVFADEPLIIENKALGYRITYQLEHFIHNWKKRTIIFTGYSLFEELTTDKPKVSLDWKQNREMAYNGSLMHFMRSLYNNRLQQDSFEVRRLRKVLNVEKMRIKKLYEMETQKKIVQGGRISFPTAGRSKDTLNYFQQILQQDDSLAIIGRYLLNADSIVTTGIDATKTFFFPNYLQVVYRKGIEEKEYLYSYRIFRPATYQKSLITLMPAVPIVIQRSGLFFPPQNIFSLDYWGWSEKVSHMLPWDYYPAPN